MEVQSMHPRAACGERREEPPAGRPRTGPGLGGRRRWGRGGGPGWREQASRSGHLAGAQRLSDTEAKERTLRAEVRVSEAEPGSQQEESPS